MTSRNFAYSAASFFVQHPCRRARGRHSLSRWGCALALLVFPLLGCNTVEGSTGGAGGMGGADGMAGGGGTAGGGTAGTSGSGGIGGTASLLVTTVGVHGGGTPNTRLEGVELCETDTTNCALTDADGQATIEFPFNQEISYTLEKDGYAPWLAADVTDAIFPGAVFFWLYSHDASAEFYGSMMSPYPQQGTGMIFLSANPSIAGATFDLIGATGKPFYMDRGFSPSADLNATGRSGDGGFAEVSPGEHQVEFGGTATGRGNCVLGRGWPGDKNNRIRVPVREGYATWGSMACEPNTVPLWVQVTESDGETPLEGVELCQTDTANCRTTDAGGWATIDLPFNQEISYTLEKDGYGSLLVGDVTDSQFPETASFFMFTVEELAQGFDRLMSPYPQRGTGAIVLRTVPDFAGATFDLIGATGKAFYYDEMGMESLDLDATTSNGYGGFVEVSPDEFQVEFGGTATGCTLQFAWPGDAENRIRVPVRVGYASFGGMFCDAPGTGGIGGDGGGGGVGS